MTEQLSLTPAPQERKPTTTPDLMGLLDARGRKRSAVTLPGYKPPRPPANKGKRFPPDPLTVEDIAKLLEACAPQRPGAIGVLSAMRLRALVILLWRSGLRISEALALEEHDLSQRERTIIVRHGKGDKRRVTLMDEWGWMQIRPWLERRATLPPGQVFCVLNGPTAGRAMSDSDARRQIREAATRANVRHRVHPHGFRHTHAVELWREGVDLLATQQQLGHSRLDVTQLYLRGITIIEVLEPIGQRKPPMMMVPGSYE